MKTRYPIYVISKGRWESRLTSRSLEDAGIPYLIAVEPQEYDQYAAVIDPSKIIVTPFSNLGQGSIPVRNFVWEHSMAAGAARHWVLDDNIGRGVRSPEGEWMCGFWRFNRNLKTPVRGAGNFRVIEEWTDRYENVAMSGMNYFMFASRKSGNIPPITLNTRIYSCILINNAMPYRWRGRYNEDTDLSLRALKGGLCTALFNAFLCHKQPTMTMKGGNSDELYQDDGRLKMAQSLVDQHPDVTKITWKWGRWQHHVDYSPFKRNALKRKPGIEPTDRVNEFGMVYQELRDGKWTTIRQRQEEAG